MEYYRSSIVYARDAVESDIEGIKNNLRESTVKELWAVHHFTPEQSLRYSLKNSVFAFSVICGDDVVAMGGVLTPEDLLSNVAPIWFLTSKTLDKIELSFLRQCRKFVKMMLDIYPTVYNWVDCRNKPAIKWLKWIGASFGETAPFGMDNIMFQYFQFTKKV